MIADSAAAAQLVKEILSLLWDPKMQCFINNSDTLAPALRQINQRSKTIKVIL
jgi:hypothetical protein